MVCNKMEQSEERKLDAIHLHICHPTPISRWETTQCKTVVSRTFREVLDGKFHDAPCYLGDLLFRVVHRQEGYDGERSWESSGGKESDELGGELESDLETGILTNILSVLFAQRVV